MCYSYEDNVAAYVESLAHAHENQWTELEASCELLDQAGVAIEEICLTHGLPSALISVASIPEVDETSEQFHDAPTACASSNASTPRRDDSPGLFSPVASKFSRTSSLTSIVGVPVIRTSRFHGGMKHSASVPALDSLASIGSSSDLIPNQVYYVSKQSLHSIPATVNDGNHRTACMKHSVSVPALNHLAIHEHLPSVGQLIQPISSNRRLISQASNISLQSNDSTGYFAADCGDDRDPSTLRRMPSAALSACDGGDSNYSSRVPSRVHSVADMQAMAFATGATSPLPASLAKARSFSQEFRAQTPTNRVPRQGNQSRAGGLAVGVGAVDCKEAEVAALCHGNITSVASSSRSSQGISSRSSSSGSGGGGGGTRKVGAVRSMKKMLASLFETERKMSVKVWTGGNPHALDLHGNPINTATQSYRTPAVVQAGYRENLPARNMPKDLIRHLEMPVAQ
ncbi:unnamed protein product [Closterium sp. NIES-53]